MEREIDKSDQLLQRIFHSLNRDSELSEDTPEHQDVMENLREENDALRKTLRMHNGLRQRFEQIYDASPVSYLTISGNGCVVEANLMAARLFGIQRSWLIGQNIDHYISDTDYHLFARHIDYVSNTHTADACTFHMLNGKRQQFLVRMESAPCLNEGQSPHTVIYSSISVIEQANQPGLLPDNHGEDQITELTENNKQLEKEIKHLQGTETALLQYHEQLEKHIRQQSREIETLRNRLASEAGERKRTAQKNDQDQEHFSQMSRLNSVVELATGLAHEINQPLSAITTYSQSCLRKLQLNENPQRLQTLVEQILVQTQRATNIIQHLRDFISKGQAHREITNINKVIQYAINVLRNDIIKNDIKININQPKPVPQIMADPVQIEQVMLNLIQNAIDALKKVPRPKRELNIELSRSPTHICVTVQDTGPGVTHQNADRIIKPFFTTKTDGMGLGLAISRAIVLDHGGQLIHKKNMKKGATFQATLAIDGQTKAS